MKSSDGSRHTLATFPAATGAPVACTIEKGGMTARLEEFRQVFGFIVHTSRTPDGFRWIFRDEPGFELRLRELAEREHGCCEFLTFTILRENGCVVWEVRGAEEAQAAIDVFFRLPQGVHHDVETLKGQAEQAGLPFCE